jgi:hypothetical protein
MCVYLRLLCTYENMNICFCYLCTRVCVIMKVHASDTLSQSVALYQRSLPKCIESDTENACVHVSTHKVHHTCGVTNSCLVD